MLTVRELIKALENQDPDALILVYANEDDSFVESAECVKPIAPCGDYQVNGYYCQGDSVAAFYAECHPSAKFVAIIGNTY